MLHWTDENLARQPNQLLTIVSNTATKFHGGTAKGYKRTGKQSRRVQYEYSNANFYSLLAIDCGLVATHKYPPAIIKMQYRAFINPVLHLWRLAGGARI
eukprot:scaffold177338_cov20-Prasinocladus_malaysianus.AAC.1